MWKSSKFSQNIELDVYLNVFDYGIILLPNVKTLIPDYDTVWLQQMRNCFLKSYETHLLDIKTLGNGILFR